MYTYNIIFLNYVSMSLLFIYLFIALIAFLCWCAVKQSINKNNIYLFIMKIVHEAQDRMYVPC